MSIRKKIVLVMLLFLCGAQTQALVLGAQPEKSLHETKRADSIIVKYKGEISARKIILTSNDTVEKAIARFNENPRVDYAEPNYIFQASLVPDDTHYTNQWYLRRIKAPDAWSYASTSPAVVIAIIDSGVQIDHPDISPNLWINASEINNNKKDDDGNGLVDDYYGWDFINNLADPRPKFKQGFTEAGVLHGTIVAGIAAASGNNKEGVTGVTWKAKIMSLKALDDAGNGDTASVAKAVDYAVAKGANIINLSFVGFSYSRSLKEAIERAVKADVIVVAPAGNEESVGHGVNLNTKPIYPACYKDDAKKPLVVGVAATDAIDQKAVFSGYGNDCVALAAPGISFYSTSVFAPTQNLPGKPFNQYYDGYWSGTSVAVPLVSGALALIQGANPQLSSSQSLKILLDTTDNINAINPDYSGQLGKGRLNLYTAISSATASLKTREVRLVIAPALKVEPFVKITDRTGFVIDEFLAYDRSFKGGVVLASGDINNDGEDEIITGPASGLESDIKIFDKEGNFIRHFLAYPAFFKGGVNIATADLNSDGKYEIITAPASGYKSEIKVFTGEGKLVRSFLAYPESFKGGASITVGDVMGNSSQEIVVGTGKTGIPQVKIFSDTGKVLSSFLADKRSAATGLRIALLDIDGNARRRQSEIVITRQSNSALAVVTDYKGNVRRQWPVYGSSFRGDVKVLTADINADGLKEIIASPGSGGGPHLRFFNHLGNLINSFYAYSPDFNGGVNMAVFYIKR